MVTPIGLAQEAAPEEQVAEDLGEATVAEEEHLLEAPAEAPADDTAAPLAKAEARLAALEQENSRLKQQNASHQGNLRQRTKIDDELADTRRQIRGVYQQLEALVGLHGTDDPEEKGRQITAIRQRMVQTQAMDETQRRSTEIYQDVLAYAERVGLDAMTAPEFATVRQTFNRAFGTDGQINNLGHMEAARRLAESITWDYRNAKANGAAPAVPVATPVAPKPKPAGFAPTATGRPGAVAINDDNADLLHMQGKITDEQYRTFLRR